MRHGERGSAALVVLLSVGLVGASLAALGALAILYGARVEASAAADAAALAAAVATFPPASRADPVDEAARLAAANGARLVSCECTVDASLATRVALVIVARDVTVPFFDSLEVRAGARAEFDPVAWLGP